MADNNQNNGDTLPGDETVPEVEAEIVEDDGAEKSAFEDEPSSSANASETPPAKPKTLTPGVILFLVFAFVAVSLFVVWRIQSSGAGKEEAAQTETMEIRDDATPEAETPATSEIVPDVEEEPKTSEPENTAPVETAPASTTSGKIDNAAAEGVKEAVRGADPKPSPPTGDVYLPPLPQPGQSSGGNIQLTPGAKDALRQTPPQEEEVERETAPDAVEEDTTHAPDDFEFETAESDVEANEAIEEAAAVTETEEPESGPKIANNDTEDLKEAVRAETAALRAELEAERSKNAELEDEISTLRREMQAALQARDAETNETLTALKAELDKIKNDPIPAARRASGFAAWSDLARAVSESRPYVNELDAIAQLAPDTAAVATLRKYAAAGVPQEQELKKNFGAAARDGLAAAGRENASGPLAGLFASIRNLVSIRPAQPQAGDTPRAIISRAEAAVDTGDFQQALTQLNALPPHVAQAMDEWITGARGYVESAKAISDLETLFSGAG